MGLYDGKKIGEDYENDTPDERKYNETYTYDPAIFTANEPKRIGGIDAFFTVISIIILAVLTIVLSTKIVSRKKSAVSLTTENYAEYLTLDYRYGYAGANATRVTFYNLVFYVEAESDVEDVSLTFAIYCQGNTYDYETKVFSLEEGEKYTLHSASQLSVPTETGLTEYPKFEISVRSITGTGYGRTE